MAESTAALLAWNTTTAYTSSRSLVRLTTTGGELGKLRLSLYCTVHRCMVRPWIRDLLVGVAKRKGFLELNTGGVVFARRACLHG